MPIIVSKWFNRSASVRYSRHTKNMNFKFDCRKDVRLPKQLQRAMAAEAEADRESKAKVHNQGCFFIAERQ